MRSVGPAGLVTSTVADVLAFARMHLAGGLAADGTRVLSEESAAAMTAHEADLPDKYILGDSWGLGWIRFGWDGQRLIGHDGNTLGQAAFLRILPEQGLAVALLTNGGHTRDLYEDLYRELFAELADVEMPQPLTPPEEPVTVDVTPYVGRYERASVLHGGAGRRAHPAHHDHRTARRDGARPGRGVPDGRRSGPALFAVKPPEAETWAPVTFYELPTGERYVHFGVRATPQGGLMDLSLLLARPARARRVRVAVVGPRCGGAARRTSSRGSAPPVWASRRSTSSSTAAPTCAGGSAPVRRGCWCSATTTRSGRWDRWRRTRGPSEGGVVRGPGCFDMKAGLAMAFHALADLDDRDGVTLLVTGDEEIGSPTSRALIEEEAPERVGGAGARGLGRRRRAQDRAQGRLAVRRARARPGRARRARARAAASTPPSSWPTRPWSSRRSPTRPAAPRSRPP